ncbi:TPA: hypothetical protein HA231_02035 [Candidatus Woesearchaeota archaeon]|nr:hypothetical protein [Candidatus Woesearchaeota archaeon]
MRCKPGVVAFISGLLLVLLLVGCSPQDPAQEYLSYYDKTVGIDEYKIVYDVMMPSLPMVGSLGMKIGIFKKGERSKVVSEVSMFGMAFKSSAYTAGGFTITCTDGLGFLGLGTGSVQCEASEAVLNWSGAEMKSLGILNEGLASGNIVIKRAGQGSAAGRSCAAFDIEIVDMAKFISETLSSMIGNSVRDYSALSDAWKEKGLLSTCMDRKTGLPLLMNFSVSEQSELVEENGLTSLMTFSAALVSESFDDSELELPVSGEVAGSACSEDGKFAVVFLPFRSYDGEVTLNISGIEPLLFGAGTAALEPFVPKLFELQTSREQSYSDEYGLCRGGECLPFSCESRSELGYGCVTVSADRKLCELKAECAYKFPVCGEFDCSGIESEQQCSSDKRCSWTGYYCDSFDCSAVESGEACSANSECLWRYSADGGVCVKFSCYYLEEKDDCSSNPKCSWVANEFGSYCTEK